MGLGYSKSAAQRRQQELIASYSGKAFWKRALLEPPPATPASADEEKVIASLPAWKRYLLLPPPGKVEDCNVEARDMAPDTFQGFRSEFNRLFGEPSSDVNDDVTTKNSDLKKSVLSQWFASPRLFVTNLMTIAPPPPQLAQYYPPGVKTEEHMFAAQFVAGPLSFMGRVDRGLSLFGTASLSLAQRLKVLFQGQTQHKKGIPMECAAEVRGSLGPSTTHAKFQRAEKAFSVGHMQRLTENLSVGSEAIFFLQKKLRCVSVAARWLVAQGSGVLAGVCTATPAGLDLSYTQRLSRYFRVSTELNVGKNDNKRNKKKKNGMGTLETNVAGGWEYRVSDTTVKGRVSSDMTLETSVEESLGEMCNVSLSAVMNIPQHSYNWGFGLQFNS